MTFNDTNTHTYTIQYTITILSYGLNCPDFCFLFHRLWLYQKPLVLSGRESHQWGLPIIWGRGLLFLLDDPAVGCIPGVPRRQLCASYHLSLIWHSLPQQPVKDCLVLHSWSSGQEEHVLAQRTLRTSCFCGWTKPVGNSVACSVLNWCRLPCYCTYRIESKVFATSSS